MNDKLDPKQLEALNENLVKLADRFIKETAIVARVGGEGNKKAATNTGSLVIKMMAVIDGTGRNMKQRSDKHAAEMDKKDAADAMTYAMAEAAKINQRVGKRH